MNSRLLFRTLCLCILLGSTTRLAAQSFSTTDIALAALTGASSVDGGDYDNDGDLDLLVRWNDAGTWKAEILRNTSTTASISFATTGVFISNVNGDCIWADINNDSKLDIIASGFNGAENFLTAFINNAGTFTTQIQISADFATNLDWGDVDADGDQDLLVTTSAMESFLLTRTGPSTFSREMPNVFSENSILADYDLDGDLDVIGDGIYSNYGEEFLSTHHLFPTAYGYYNRGKISAMDLDGDGDRDLLRQEDTRARGTEAFQVVVYLNQFNTIQQNTFSRVEVEEVDDFVGPIFPIGAGDFDNNGDVEVIYVPNGNYSQYLLRFKEIKSQKVTTIDLPPNSRFHSVKASLIADLNGDQRLDIITVGGYVNTSTSESVQYAKALRNLAGANAKPSIPTNLNEVIPLEGGAVKFTWNKSTDATTPSAGITYNFYLRQGLDTLISPYATKSGKPRVHNIKGTSEANRFQFSQLANNGSYSWAVQARDAAGNYSAFSAERTFKFSGGNSEVDHSIPLKNQSIAYDKMNNQYIVVGLQGSDVYAVLLDGQFGERKSALKKLNQFTTTCIMPKVAVDSAGTYLVTWIADSVIYQPRLWGKFIKADLSVPQANEWRACEKFTDPYVYFTSHDVRYNPARNAFDLAWAFYGDAGGISARRTRLQSNVNKPDPIKRIGSTLVFGWLHGARGYVDVSIDSDPKTNRSVVAYTFENERPDGVTSYGRMFFKVLDQNLVASKDSIPAQLLPNQTKPYGSAPHIVYNPYLKNFAVIWNAHFQHQLSTLPQDGVVESRDVAAAILTIGATGQLTMYQFPTTISKAQQQGGQGGSLNPNLAFNYDRNEFLATWHNTTAGKIYGHRINPLDKVTVTTDEFPVKASLSETPATSFAKNYNHFILGFLKDGNGTTSIIEIPDDPAPVVGSLSKGKAYAGEKIIIVGSNFGKTPFVNAVYFGTIKAKVDTLFWDRTKLQVTVPTGLTRDKVAVVVSFDGQLSNTDIMFENITVSGITSVAPLVGQPGDLITIAGTNFPTVKNDVIIKFGEAIASLDDIVSISVTQIKVKIPVNAIRGNDQVVSVIIQEVPNTYQGFKVIRTPSIGSATGLEVEDELISERLMNIDGANLSFTANDIDVRIGEKILTRDKIKLANETKVTVEIPRGIDGKQFVYVSTADGEAASPVEYNFRVGADIKGLVLDNEINGDTLGGFKRSIESDFPVEVEVYNGSTVAQLKLWSKGISAPDEEWSSTVEEFTGNRKIVKLTESHLGDDPIGLEAYFEATDLSGIVKSTHKFRIFRDYGGSGSTAAIPDLRFGGNVADYNIISIPYKLSPDKINVVFKSVLDKYPYDKTKWRILHYKNDGGNGSEQYIEYNEGLDNVENGKGYWFIARNEQEILFELGKTSTTEEFGPFEITLYPGWNQIGNPYDFDVSWNYVLEYNDDPDHIEPFKTFANGSLLPATIIERYRGGFVHNSGVDEITLKIPFTQTVNGRKKDDFKFASKLDQKEWRIALDLSAGALQNRVSSFGMHPQAREGVDEKDEHKLPAFVQSLDLSFPQSLSTSIVGTNDHYSWHFEVLNTTDSKEITITWDNSKFGDNDRELFLQDIVAERLIDMRIENHYTFIYREGYNFKIHFGDQSYIEDIAKPSNVVLSDAHPNPMHSTTSIPFTVTKDRTHVHLAIYTLQGQELQTLVNDTLDPGFYELEWDGKGPGGTVTSGVVIYRLQTSESGNGVKSHFKKLVIAP
jgi:hypothetical protein